MRSRSIKLWRCMVPAWSDFIPKSELQERIDTALGRRAEKRAAKCTDQRDRRIQGRCRGTGHAPALWAGDDFASVKPKFRETVYKMLERGENAPAIAEQLKSVAEKYEEYFTKPEPAQPAAPQFGGEVKGQMPAGKNRCVLYGCVGVRQERMIINGIYST